MHLTSTISIESIGYSLGEQIPIDCLVPDTLREEELLTLQALGLEYFTKTQQTHVELVSAALEACLSKSAIPSENIHQIILSTHTFSEYEVCFPKLIEVLEQHGLKDVPLTSLYMSRCSSAVTCIRHAVYQMQAERGVDHILVILVDKALTEEKSKRTLNNGLSIFSDGACAFVVCRGQAGYFHIHSVFERVDNKMSTLQTHTDFVKYFQCFSAGAKLLCQHILEEAELKAEDFKHLIVGNYNVSMLKNYAMMTGFKPKQLYYPNLRDIAHAYSSDLLITLSHLREEGKLEYGDRVFLLGTGSFHWGSSILSYHGTN